MNGMKVEVPGAVIRARIDWVVETMSRDEIIEFFETLSPDVRRSVSGTQSSASCDASTLAEVDRVIAELFGRGSGDRDHASPTEALRIVHAPSSRRLMSEA